MFLSVGCIYDYYATMKLLTKHAACVAGSEPRVPAGGGLLPAKRRSHSKAQSSAYTRLATCPVPSLQSYCESGSSRIEPGRRKVNGKRIIIERRRIRHACFPTKIRGVLSASRSTTLTSIDHSSATFWKNFSVATGSLTFK